MPVQKEFAGTPYLPSHPTVYRHFGSMGALAHAAGLARWMKADADVRRSRGSGDRAR